MEKSSSLLIHFNKGTPALLADETEEALQGSKLLTRLKLLLKLEHFYPFIRRNAILEVMLIQRPSQGEQLLVDAPEMIEKALSSEQDLSCLSNAKLIIMVVMIMDVLRALASPKPDIRRKSIDVALEPITPLNVDEVVQALKKEVVKTQSTELEKNGEYRQMLLFKLYIYVQLKFSKVASTVVHLLMDFLGDSDVASSAIGMVGTGDLFFFSVNEEGDGADTSKPSQQVNFFIVSSRKPAVLADETAISHPTVVQRSLASPCNLRSLILTGDFFLGVVMVCTLTKLIVRFEEVQPSKPKSSFLPPPIDNGSYDRLVLCIRLLCNTGDEIRKIWLQSYKQFCKTEEIKVKGIDFSCTPDDVIDFFHLNRRKVSQNNDANKLSCILQWTGFSDPGYAEAYITVRPCNIVLDVTVINRMKETFQNYCLRTVVVLDDIHINIMDYISPATCADVAFRTMWAEFDWENKVVASTVIQDDKEFLNHIIKPTNMKCSGLDGDCEFLVANVYAKSVFDW
ncbi:hypothetical protein MKW94_016349 [Papaver nudicaule]|uniref:Coatomer beta subunit appendage platform domain-containing protein n=1 Tax=Papaver nudicaule TaxID=74823 RepID=A0AA42B1I6_PAPNU|nr:hypothetical protein [Papaver nudicaule]